jgi:hypothetical protein
MLIPTMNKLYIVIGIAIFLWSILSFSNTKILLSETKVEVGQSYFVEDYGNLSKNSQASLVCNYYNGRKMLKRVFWYSPNNIFGRDSCPTLLRD